MVAAAGGGIGGGAAARCIRGDIHVDFGRGGGGRGAALAVESAQFHALLALRADEGGRARFDRHQAPALRFGRRFVLLHADRLAAVGGRDDRHLHLRRDQHAGEHEFELLRFAISVTPSQTDLNHIIFGNLLGVSIPDLIQVLVLGVVAFVILILKRRDLTLYAFDPTHAHAIGLSPKRLGALLMGLLALTSVVALQTVGVVLVVAMLIIPGARPIC